MTPGEVVRLEDLPMEIRGDAAGKPIPVEAAASANAPAAISPASSTPAAGTLREFKDAAERTYLVQKLRENNWNISKTAEVIDTPRSNLYKN
jgi:two-component system nitrogen regulation response regulator NtrX